MSRKTGPLLTPEEKATIRELGAQGLEPRMIKDHVPRATYGQIRYYITSSSIFTREHVKTEARGRGVKV